MFRKNLVSGVGVILMAHIGSTLISCNDAETDDSERAGAGAGGTSSAVGGAGSETDTGGAPSIDENSGGGTGGSGAGGLQPRELCGIAVNSLGCKNGWVNGIYGLFCAPFSVKCENGCRSEPETLDQSNHNELQAVHNNVTEAYCESSSLGGAAREAGGDPTP